MKCRRAFQNDKVAQIMAKKKEEIEYNKKGPLDWLVGTLRGKIANCLI